MVQPPVGGNDPQIQLTNAQAYDQNLNSYLSQLSGLGTNMANQRLGALNTLNTTTPEARNAIAAARRERQTTDYKYGAGGLPTPTEVQPPLGTSGLGMANPGAGLRIALLDPEDQYNRMSGQLGTASAALNELISSARQQAELARANALAAAGGGSSGSGGGSGGGGLRPPAPATSTLFSGNTVNGRVV